jgi:N-acetylmuramoyl-L-alanine amidase
MIKCVLIESGHGLSDWGTNDPGACANGQTERNNVILLGRELLFKLKSGLKNVLVQGVGVETKATKRKKAQYLNSVISHNGYKPEECLVVSLHMNSHSSITPRGWEIWVKKNPKLYTLSDKLAKSIGVALGKTKLPARPTPYIPTAKHKWGRLYIDDFNCPAVLIEVGFISNIYDLKYINANTDNIVNAISAGINNYIKG